MIRNSRVEDAACEVYFQYKREHAKLVLHTLMKENREFIWDYSTNETNCICKIEHALETNKKYRKNKDALEEWEKNNLYG